MKKIRISAPAKINLFLNVLNRLENGYHTIDTIMQTVGLYDFITVTLEENSNEITISCDDSSLPCNDKNLAYRAAEIFYSNRYKTIPRCGIKIDIEKNIPVAAGLAGGSTDAAGVLIALNILYEDIYSDETLCDIGLALGADIPFCIRGGTVRCEGIGEKFTQCSPMPKLCVLIAIGDDHVDTKWAYETLDADIGNIPEYVLNTVPMSLERCDIPGLIGGMYNVFENIVSTHEPIKKIMYNHGALGALMSGSGPSVFGLFDDSAYCQSAADELIAHGYHTFMCSPC